MNSQPAGSVAPVRGTDQPSGAHVITAVITVEADHHERARRGRALWAWARLAVGVAVIGFVVARVGTGPFVHGLRLTTGGPLLAATALTALSTLACAWRWRRVAERLGVRIALGAAVAAIYRAQFLNATLPGGVVGDVDRALGHARLTGLTGPGVRSVVWERTLGQVVQACLAGGLLLVVPSPLRPSGTSATVVAIALLALVAVVVVVAVARPGRGLGARLLRATGTDLRAILGSSRDRAGIAVASALAVVGHVLVFLLAARAAGVAAPTAIALPLAAVVLTAAAVPANLAGWGPREGVAAWSFAVAGLGADSGVTTSVVYGVLALVATVPGGVLLLLDRGRSARHSAVTVPPVLQDATHG